MPFSIRAFRHILILLLCFDDPAFGAEFGADFPGHLVALLDGDKVDISYHDTKEAVPLRLYGIDAPEQGQPYWQGARDFLRKLLDSKKVKVLVGPFSHGGNERLIATVILPDGTTANRALIKAGLAWVYEQDFSDDMEPDRKDELRALELEARNAKKGLWADPHPMPPWEWREAKVIGGSGCRVNSDGLVEGRG